MASTNLTKTARSVIDVLDILNIELQGSIDANLVLASQLQWMHRVVSEFRPMQANHFASPRIPSPLREEAHLDFDVLTPRSDASPRIFGVSTPRQFALTPRQSGNQVVTQPKSHAMKAPDVADFPVVDIVELPVFSSQGSDKDMLVPRPSSRPSIKSAWRQNVDELPSLWPVFDGNDSTLDFSSRPSRQASPSDPKLRNFLEQRTSHVRVGDTMSGRGYIQKCIAHPTSVRPVLWDLVSVIILAVDVALIPLATVGFVDLHETSWYPIMHVSTTVFWTLDIINSFTVGYHDGGVVELRPVMIARRYGKKWFALDVALISLDWFLIFADTSAIQMLTVMRFSKSLRILKVLRAFRMLRVVGHFRRRASAFSDDLMTTLGIFKLVCGIVIICHILACGWYAIGRIKWGQGISSWVDSLDARASSHADSWGYRYTTALHWSITQFTPASMEVSPVNSCERVYTICVVMLGMLVFSSLVSEITSATTKMRLANVERSRHMDDVRRYMREHGISMELTQRIFSYFRQASRFRSRLHEDDVSALKGLPDTLRGEMHFQTYLPILMPHPFFHHFCEADECSTYDICNMAMQESSVMKDLPVFSFGERATTMFFMLSGTSEYFEGTSGENSTYVAGGESICEVVLWLEWVHRGRLIGASTCEFATLSSEIFREIMKSTARLMECQQYAQRFAAKFLESGGCSDTWGGFDFAQELAQEAFQNVTNQAVGRLRKKSSSAVMVSKSMSNVSKIVRSFVRTLSSSSQSTS